MNRAAWEFNYRGDALLKAALAKKKYHHSRHAWWSNKKEDVLKTIRKSGVEVNESIVDELRKSGYATSNNAINTVSLGGGQIRIRTDLVAKLQECASKIETHSKLVREYDGWVQAFSSSKKYSFYLQVDDWLFFFGK